MRKAISTPIERIARQFTERFEGYVLKPDTVNQAWNKAKDHSDPIAVICFDTLIHLGTKGWLDISHEIDWHRSDKEIAIILCSRRVQFHARLCEAYQEKQYLQDWLKRDDALQSLAISLV